MKITVHKHNETLETTFEKTLSIGRSQKCDLIIQDEAISRYHCQIEEDNGIILITDLSSANGVFINGQRISPNTKTQYSTFLSLSIGPFECNIVDANKTFTKLSFPKDENKIAKLKPITSQGKIHLKAKPKIAIKNIAIIVTIIFFSGMIYLYIFERPLEKNNFIVQVPKVTSLSKKQANAKSECKDIFFKDEDYAAHEKNKTCKDLTFLCQNLDLDEKRGEGIFLDKKNKTYILFANISKYSLSSENQNGYELKVLMAAKKLIQSEAYYGLLREKTGQMQIVIMNDAGISRLVLGTDLSCYPNDFDRNVAVNDIEKALENKDPVKFWQIYRNYFPRKQFL